MSYELIKLPEYISFLIHSRSEFVSDGAFKCYWQIFFEMTAYL
jgi:hypothetical protein